MMEPERKSLIVSGLFGLVNVVVGYYLLWGLGNNWGYVFIALAVANHIRVQKKIRKK